MKVLSINQATGEEEISDGVSASEVSTTPTTNGIPRAVSGKLDVGWLSGPLPLSILPVADNGEVSSTELVRADDSRLGNPAVGGDLSGTAQAASVIKLRGRVIANVAPSDGDGLVWNQTANQWEPDTVGGDAGDATSIQGNPVSSAAPATGDALVWTGTQWEPDAVEGGGGGSTGEKLILFERYW